ATLALDVANADRQVEIGVETTYEIRVANRGGLAGTGIQVLAVVPEGMEPRSATGPVAYRFQGQQVLFAPLDRLEPGAAALFRVTVRCLTRGDKHFRAQVASNQAHLPLCREEVTIVYADRN